MGVLRDYIKMLEPGKFHLKYGLPKELYQTKTVYEKYGALGNLWQWYMKLGNHTQIMGVLRDYIKMLKNGKFPLKCGLTKELYQ